MQERNYVGFGTDSAAQWEGNAQCSQCVSEYQYLKEHQLALSEISEKITPAGRPWYVCE